MLALGAVAPRPVALPDAWAGSHVLHGRGGQTHRPPRCGKRSQQVRRWLERRGRRAVRPPRESQVRTRRRLTESPVIGPRANTAAARVEGERAPSGRRALVGLESAPMDALGRAERLTIQSRKKPMSVIAKAIAARQSEIERLQAEIKALNDVDKILGTSAPAKPAARRSSSRRPAAAATPVAETASDATPARKRRPMTAKEKEAVSERMKASWAARRKKAAK